MKVADNKERTINLVVCTGVVFGLFILLGFLGTTFWVIREYEQVADQYGLNNFDYQEEHKGVICSSDGEVLTELYDKNKEQVTLDKISLPMRQSIIAIEDHRFYDHFGIDVVGTVRALFRDITHREAVEGGSTITQQLVRNLFLTNDKTISRKVTEVLLAVNMERRFTKDEILEMYLNEIYFGNGCYGVETAANKYFGKHAADLDIAEATILAGIPKSPSTFEPIRHQTENKSRQKDTLSRMVELKMLSSAEAEEISNRPVKINNFTIVENKPQYKFPYFTTEVINQLVEKYGKEKVYNGGLKVVTTLNAQATRMAEEVVKRKVAEFRRNGISATNMAIVSVSPADGAVVSLVGGVDFNKDQNNLALLPRQPGSSIKPINYAGAIDKGVINESTLISARAKSFGNYYVASNTDADVTVFDALKYSMNVPSVEIVNTFGINNVINNLKKFGITTVTKDDANLALALGGMYYGIKPLEMAAAFATFANEGKYNKPYMIKTITDAEGNVLYKHQNSPNRIISKNTANVITRILTGVVQGGTGTKANISGNEAGKTGTTDDSRCLWFVGFNQELATAVWVGNTNNKPVYGYYGGDLAAPAWREYMLALMDNKVLSIPEHRLVPVVNETPEVQEKPKQDEPQPVTQQTSPAPNTQNIDEPKGNPPAAGPTSPPKPGNDTNTKEPVKTQDQPKGNTNDKNNQGTVQVVPVNPTPTDTVPKQDTGGVQPAPVQQ